MNRPTPPEPAPDATETVTPYAALAAGYDVVMEHVDYEGWAGYVFGLLRRHHPNVETVLELGCGTGTFAFELQPLGPFRYLATDAVPSMVRVAEAKADFEPAEVQFAVADFTNFRIDAPVDAVLLLYDGLNYLLEADALSALFAGVSAALKPGGLFILDQSTPANSLNNEQYFEDEGEAEGFAYRRLSHYDRDARIHTTTFELLIEGKTYYEEHRQRAYAQSEVRARFVAEGFEELAAYDGFTSLDAGEASERVHWVLRKPEG